MPSLESMRSCLTQLSTNTNNNQTQEKTYRPSDPQEVNLNSINSGEEVKIRFVEDGDKNNIVFWRAYCYHELCFRGVKGDESKSNVVTTIRVPAYNVTMDNFGRQVTTNDGSGQPMMLNPAQVNEYTNFQDPIQLYVKKNNIYGDSRTVVDAQGKEITLYNALKRKIQYLMQGYIISAPESLKIYPEARALKHFRITDKVYNLIRRFVADPENIDNPIDNNEGVCFNFRKTMQGQFPNYDTCTFARNKTNLAEISPEAAEDFEKYGPDFIADRIPKTPTQEERDVIAKMLEEYLAGNPYDTAWDSLGYPKFTKQMKMDEPTWNTPQNTYNAVSAPTQSQATIEAAEVIASISGGAQPVINDSIPYAEPTPSAQPTVQASAQPSGQVQQMNASETLAFLNNLN